MKCVVTRDKDGFVGFWPIKFKKLYKDCDGAWNTGEGGRIASVAGDCFEDLVALLRFSPRKGSKQKVEITVKKLK